MFHFLCERGVVCLVEIDQCKNRVSRERDLKGCDGSFRVCVGDELCEWADVGWDEDCCYVGVGGGATVEGGEAEVGWRDRLFQDLLEAEYVSVCLKVLCDDGVCCVLSFLYVVRC